MGGNIRRVRWATPATRKQIQTTKAWASFLSNVMTIVIGVPALMSALRIHG